LAASQQLARAGHDVTLFREERPRGGLLRYVFPDFKMEKSHIEPAASSSSWPKASRSVPACWWRAGRPGRRLQFTNWPRKPSSPEQLMAEFDAVLLTGGAEQSRDLPCRAVNSRASISPWSSCRSKTRSTRRQLQGQLRADGKHVIVIGGGDTGSDCVGTSNRHGAVSVTQFELMPMPPEQENKPLVWPYWPIKLRTSSSHEEGCEREFAIATKEFIGEKGQVTAVKTVRIEMKDGKMVEVPGSEQCPQGRPGACWPWASSPPCRPCSTPLAWTRTHAAMPSTTDFTGGYATSVPKLFAAGDVRRGQSWWSGPSAKAARPLAPSTSSSGHDRPAREMPTPEGAWP
ncbi:glutamate synthase [NADPH] small chain-like, partial [Melopsittacus undulatus]|uniref:glutamate synthase [NADPH] small chain-like n=1 Tax=Melopsittacus undulatus TaxID=13146 RepID=UPI00146E247A